MASFFLSLNISVFFFSFVFTRDVLETTAGGEVWLNSCSKEEMDVVYLSVLYKKFGKFARHTVLITNVPTALFWIFHYSSDSSC